MTGLVIRLAGPLQSWGEHSAFTHRDTQPFPTRSGLIGLFASAQGIRRDQPLTRYQTLRVTVRIDRPGLIISDFHTIGGGRARHETPLTAEGTRRPTDTATIVTRRHYLSDAVFTVAIDGPAGVLNPLAEALKAPHWQPFLGRRSCPPDQPLLLRSNTATPVRDLHTKVPIPRRPPTQDRDTDDPIVDFVSESTHDNDDVVTELNDVPESYADLDRRYRTRAVAITGHPVSRDLWKGSVQDYRQALHDYMEAR